MITRVNVSHHFLFLPYQCHMENAESVVCSVVSDTGLPLGINVKGLSNSCCLGYLESKIKQIADNSLLNS